MDQTTDAERDIRTLRREIVKETASIARVTGRRDNLRKKLSECAATLRATNASRDNHVRQARALGATADELAEDTGLTPGRIRQIAPQPKAPKAKPRPRGRGSAPAAARPRRTEVTLPVEAPAGEADDQDQDDDDTCTVIDTPAGTAVVRGRGPMTARDREAFGEVLAAAGRRYAAEHPDDAPAPAPRRAASQPPRGKKPLPPLPGPYSIGARVEQALALYRGDMEQATLALVDSAMMDSMTLLDQCRAGARYDYTAHPSLPDPLVRPGRKQSDMIWEGRPNWRRAAAPGSRVDVLDTNAAYLAAIRRVHLPIGRLEKDPDGTPFDRRRSGIYLVDPPRWLKPGVPDPLGSRRETGPVWVTRPTLQLLQRAYADPGLPILESYTSGSSENLLTKFGDTMAAARASAIADRDPVTGAYVKAMYSKFVSTAGDSSKNHEIFRPEWVHAIRSQAFMNLWLKGAKAAAPGIGLEVVGLLGTDELHVIGDWRAAMLKGQPAFPEGRGLAQTKCKRSYTLGRDGRAQREQEEVTDADMGAR